MVLTTLITTYRTRLIAGAVVIALSFSGFVFYKYRNSLIKQGQVEITEVLAKETVEQVTESVERAKAADVSYTEAAENIEKTFEFIKEDIEDAEVNETGNDISDSAVADILCKNGLASKRACEDYYSVTTP